MTIAAETRVCGICHHLTTAGHLLLHDDGRVLAPLCRPCFRLLGLDLPAGLDKEDVVAVLNMRLEQDSDHLDTVFSGDN